MDYCNDLPLVPEVNTIPYGILGWSTREWQTEETRLFCSLTPCPAEESYTQIAHAKLAFVFAVCRLHHFL